MIEYGYINKGGYLVSKYIEEYTEQYREKGEVRQRTVSVETQAASLSAAGWKPVDPVDAERLKCEEGYIVRITPYDAGDRISYNYETVFDAQKIKREIQALKDELAGEDYKITKCYEASLLGKSLPYDINELHTARQTARDRINELEESLRHFFAPNSAY